MWKKHAIEEDHEEVKIIVFVIKDIDNIAYS